LFTIGASGLQPNAFRRALFELFRVLGRPPVAQIPLRVELASLVVEPVRQLVPDDGPDRAEVHRVVELLVEERRLQDAGGEVDVVHERVVVRVHRRRRHLPLAAIHRLADPVQFAPELEGIRTLGVVADLLEVSCAAGGRRRGVFEDVAQDRAVAFFQLVEPAPTRLVGRDRIAGHPPAARELVEIDAWAGGAIERRGVEPRYGGLLHLGVQAAVEEGKRQRDEGERSEQTHYGFSGSSCSISGLPAASPAGGRAGQIHPPRRDGHSTCMCDALRFSTRTGGICGGIRPCVPGPGSWCAGNQGPGTLALIGGC